MIVRMVDVETSGVTESLALRWLQKYICEFGGDPEKVMMYVKWFLSSGSADIFQLGSKRRSSFCINSYVGKRWEQ
jgi:hypothetical protein